MVIPQREVRHRPNPDRIVDHDRALFDRTDAENRDLRLVDDWHPKLCPELAGVRDRERAAMYFVRIQTLRPCTLGDIRNRATETEYVFLVRVLDHRHDQAVVESNGDSKIDVLLVNDVIAVDRRVHDRMPMQGLND